MGKRDDWLNQGITPGPASKRPGRRTAKAAKAAKTASATGRARKAKVAGNGTRKVASAKLPLISREDIALRAYFIAEKRHREGLPGDEHQDWIEAERQLQAERRPKRRKAPSA
jgi:hypothetical protein